MTISRDVSSDSDSNTKSDGRNHEMLQAKILFDHEIEDMVRHGGLEVFPLIEHLFKANPYADPQLILYTASEHIRENGIPEDDTFPNELIELPDTPDTFEPVIENSSGAVRPGGTGEIEELAPLPEEEEVDVRAAIRARREERRARANNRGGVRNVNVRSVMEEIDQLGL